MADLIGNITVPEPPAASAVFPLTPAYPVGVSLTPEVAVHQFGSANAKIEQRFLLGTGAKRWTVGFPELTDGEIDSLYSFWESRKGAYGPFLFDAPDADGTSTRHTVRFANEPLTVERLLGAIASAQCTLIEVPSAPPTYTLNSTVTRFPSSALATALLDQVQALIPLIKIEPKTTGYPAIYVSDRRCTVGGQLYQARLLEWDGIQQELGNGTDEATFTFGNADRVMRDLANDTDLVRASIEFSLFHVGTGIKLDLWKGEITSWDMDAGPEFRVTASDGIYELTLPYPCRKISRTCPKLYNDGNACPFTDHGSMDLVHFSGAAADSCDRGYETPNGCLAHGMKRYFGGIIAKPQGVRITDNGSGALFKLGRQMITATSLVADSIYDRPLKEIYTDVPIPVNCDIASGRDESDFYDALGIVGEGPIGAFGSGHKLDGQLHHGYPGPLGLREVKGNDPATGGVTPSDSDTFFSLGQSGDQRGGNWRRVFAGASTYEDTFAAGTAFIELRRADEKGIQLTRLDAHEMQAIINQGISSQVWTGAGTRSLTATTDPVWIAVNAMLKARALKFASAATAEKYFDASAAIAAATICDTVVDSLITGTEKQFRFIGVIEQEKPLRDWIQEILANCLGYFTFSFGKLKVGLRKDATVVSAFTAGNMLWQSLHLSPVRPAFNQLTATYADEGYEFVSNSVTIAANEHAAFLAGGAGPLFLKGTLNLAGTSTASQAGRIATVRLREELGGATLDEWRKARQATWETTVLALDVEPGMVVSITDPDMPDGVGKLRVTGWRLNKDYSIELQGRTVTESMYNVLDAGPKLADVEPDPIPPELFPAPFGPVWQGDYESAPANDPMFGSHRTFAVSQEYREDADGVTRAMLTVTGRPPINDFIPETTTPIIRSYSTHTPGGHLKANTSYLVAVCARSSSTEFTPPSNIIQVQTGDGADAWYISLDEIEWPAGTYASCSIFAAGADARKICVYDEVSGSLPSTYAVRNLPRDSGYGMPSILPKFVRVKEKEIIHSGVAYGIVSGIASYSITCANLATLGDDWTGRDFSVIADRNDGSAAMWNYRCVAWNNATGTATVDPAGPNPADNLEVDDVAIVRTLPDTITAASIGDSRVANGQYPGGDTVDRTGSLIQILSGPGAGQIRRIVSNTTTVYTVDRPWDVMPTAASRYLVVASDWAHQQDSSTIRNRRAQAEMQIAIPVANALASTRLVGGFIVDRRGNETPEELAHYREVYLFGDYSAMKQYTVTVTADYSATAKDRVILVDASGGNVTVTLVAGSVVKEKPITVKRIDTSANTVTVVGSGADTIEGAESQTLMPGESITVQAA